MWSVFPLPPVGLGTEPKIRSENQAQSSENWIIELSLQEAIGIYWKWQHLAFMGWL